MKLALTRIYRGSEYSIGRLYIDGTRYCDTLEDCDRHLTKSMTESQIRRAKVAGKTAIPTGTYPVTLRVKSPKFSRAKYEKQYGFCDGYLPRLLGVPGYDGVLIHIGNTAADTDGCILVGKNKVRGKVLESTATFRSLYARLLEAERRRESISMEIR